MARLVGLCFSLLFVLLSADFIISADLSDNSPGPAPESGSDSPISQPSFFKSGAPASAPSIHTPSPDMNSPPSPPLSNNAPSSSPTPSSDPSPSVASDINKESNVTGDEESKVSSGGLKSGQKAGIVIGVIVGAGIVGIGGLVYKKRQDNIRRSQYGYAARREIL